MYTYIYIYIYIHIYTALHHRLLGEDYKLIRERRALLSNEIIIAHVEGLQALSAVLERFEGDSHSVVTEAERTEQILAACSEAQASKLKAANGFSRYQNDVRMHAASNQDQELANKLKNRDTARANLCRELRDSLARIALVVCREKCASHAEELNVMAKVLGEGRDRVQVLQGALAEARDCVIKYNLPLTDVSVRMGASFDTASCQDADTAVALGLWQEWKQSLPFERVAAATDACMQKVHDEWSQGLMALLGIGNQQQQQLEGAEEHTTSIKDTLVAAGKAVDEEALVPTSSPMLVVPMAPLMTAAERLLQAMEGRIAALQSACTMYEGFRSMHDAENKCLDVHGKAYTRQLQAVDDMQQASKAHRRALGELKQEEVFEQYPELAEAQGVTIDQVHEKVKDKRRALKEAANVLQTALATLLEMQDDFPEACMHIKAGLPRELLPVWRPDLTLEMFDMHESLATGSNHTVYKASMDGKLYALKEFRLGNGEQGLQELMKEAAMLRRMRHPAIVEIISLFEVTAKGSKRLLMQMPFFEHGTLHEWVAMEAPEWRTVRTVLLDVAGALEYLHGAAVVHCDVKPANILVAPSYRGRLADFDISVDSATRMSTRFATTKLAFTPGFDAPELARYTNVSMCMTCSRKHALECQKGWCANESACMCMLQS